MCFDLPPVQPKFQKRQTLMDGWWEVGNSTAAGMAANRSLLRAKRISDGPWKAELFRMFGLCRAVQSGPHRQTGQRTCLAQPCAYGIHRFRPGELFGETRFVTTGKIKLA